MFRRIFLIAMLSACSKGRNETYWLLHFPRLKVTVTWIRGGNSGGGEKGQIFLLGSKLESSDVKRGQG